MGTLTRAIGVLVVKAIGSFAQKPIRVSLDVCRQTLEMNFIGVVAITQALLPLIHRSKSGRILNMSHALGLLLIVHKPNYH
ncbi:MAG: hypothetical protein B0A82_15010 [Alkalinema sp. CACIAM 70d]|nr:MAG: hypothetical protein B0A82_15010 [Alkalinema sp. CACIAM 70d]